MATASPAAAAHRLGRVFLLALLTTALLCALKLAGALSWSWWVVCLPLLIPTGLLTLTALTFLGGAVFGFGVLAVVYWERTQSGARR